MLTAEQKARRNERNRWRYANDPNFVEQRRKTKQKMSQNPEYFKKQRERSRKNNLIREERKRKEKDAAGILMFRKIKRDDLSNDEIAAAIKIRNQNARSKNVAEKTGTEAATILSFTLFDMFIKQEKKCAYCGIGLDSRTLVLDKKIPSKYGGGHVIENLHFTCIKCQKEKLLFMRAGKKRERERLERRASKIPPSPKAAQAADFSEPIF